VVLFAAGTDGGAGITAGTVGFEKLHNKNLTTEDAAGRGLKRNSLGG
jgi:hypothetical protein